MKNTIKKSIVTILAISCFILMIGGCSNIQSEENNPIIDEETSDDKTKNTSTETESNDKIEKDDKSNIDDELDTDIVNHHRKIITITAIGDCTLGSFPEVTTGKSFEDVLSANNNDYEYPFKNAFKWIKSDDITLINFEGTLTDATKLANKKWRFKGPKEYTNFLTSSSIEVVNIANNHSYDYLEQGYADTVKNMNDADIGVSGNEYIYIKNIDSIKVAFIGHMAKDEPEDIFDKVKRDILKANKDGADVIVCSFHWGIEYNNMPTNYQKKLGHFAIDCGADMVIGHHPHILQGIELYNGKYIAYSLGNFVFGGNEILYDERHKDVDTILLRQQIDLDDKEIIDIRLSIVPFRLSGDTKYNNYQPIVQAGDEGLRIRDKLISLSNKLEYGIKSLEIEE
ncbi:CapA family protein [Vallitalea sp.]|uniref:CapA family protein n=1 Tax=Vallitalea sp. TaxID=1882829 RepID=UPI0025D33E71|nr:CapA family protein [Vallitalea sp.]MCT4685828.1 CapA family protein [Vallitalea sp.]